MPIYEYTCTACNAKFDQLLKTMSGKETVSCPKCGSKKTQRAMSVFAVGGEPPRSPSTQSHGGGCACCSNRGRGSCPME